MIQILLLCVLEDQLRYQLIRGMSAKGVINDSKVKEFIASTKCIILLSYAGILRCLINNSVYCENPSDAIHFGLQVHFHI